MRLKLDLSGFQERMREIKRAKLGLSKEFFCKEKNGDEMVTRGFF